jgi:chemotaxis protein methyltransferase CheR
MMLPEVVVKPVVMPTTLVQVSDAELAKFAELIYARTGIRVSPQKKTLLSNRLRRRLRDTGIASFDDYYKHLCNLRPNAPEWDAFLQEVTTHETYLFRDESQWDWFQHDFLPAHDADCRKSGRPRSLRIWSAACSTGDEAMTIACCVAACLANFSNWNVQIVGTDIGVGAVEQARTAVFGDRAMRLVPENYRTRFFTKAKDAQIWQAKPMLTAMASFRQHNLMAPLRESPFDLVFLKNVLIYFDAASKLTVLSNVRSAIRPGGLLVAGAAEGVSDLIKDFERIQPWLYRKPK